MPAVKVTHLVKNFRQKVAVNDVSFQIAQGEVFGLLGPNGAGKSTIISILTTLLLPTSGLAEVCGYDVVKKSRETRRNIGLVFQETILDEDLSAFSNLDIHARLYHVAPAVSRPRVSELLSLVGLTGEAKTKVSAFSGGMKRRLEIARGLIHQPRVLFLDEPTIGLDPKTRRPIWDYIKKLSRETNLTILLTTHYLEEADYLCDRVAVMNEGKISVAGSPKELKRGLGGDLVRIRLAAVPAEFLSRVRQFPFVKKVSLKDTEVSLVVDNGEANGAELIRLVHALSLDIKSFSLREPTLEDVFLHYTGERFNSYT